jgi:hypothetical protein
MNDPLTPPSLASLRGEEGEGQRPGAPAIGAGCDLRRIDAYGGGEDRRREASDRAGLGDEVQRPGSPELIAGKAPRPNAAPDERAPRSPGSHGGGWPDPRRSWRGALGGLSTSASLRRSTSSSRPGRRAGNCGPWTIASSRRGQASCAGGERNRGFKKDFPARLEEIAREKGVDPGSIEVWFVDVPRQGSGEGAGRPEGQDHPRLGKARNAALGPSNPRAASTDIFGAICPKEGKADGDRAQAQHRSDAAASQ